MNNSAANKPLNVSCQVLGQVFATCDKHGVAASDLLQGVPYSREYIETPANFIDWDSLVALLNNASAHFSEPEIKQLAAQSYDEPLFLIYKLMGRLRFDLMGFYKYCMSETGIVSTFYPLQCKILEEDRLSRRLAVRITTKPGLAPCKVLFQIIEGQAIGISEVMGFEAAMVDATYLPDGVELDICLPKENGFLPTLRRIFTSPINLVRTSFILQETHDELVERNRQLTLEKQQLEKTQQTLMRQQEQMHLIADHSPILLWTVDMSFRTRYCSPSVERLLGYTLEEAMSFKPLQMIDDDSKRIVGKVFERELSKNPDIEVGGRTVRSLRLRHLRKDGSRFWSDNYLALIRDDHGMPTGIVGISTDIDEQVKRANREAELEEELNQARRQEMVGKLAGGVAHDFNNALQIIIGFAELGKLDAIQRNADELAEYQEMILHAASSSSELVAQLLAFSRQQSLSMNTIEVSGWLSKLLPMMNSSLGERRNLEVSLAPHQYAVADPSALERVVINLVLNARDALPDGGTVTLTTETVAAKAIPVRFDPQSAEYVRLAVRDDGVGVSEDILGRIFDPYFSTKPAESGSGLGLAVSNGIVQQHGGVMHAFPNESGQGITVEVYIPCTEAGMQAVGPETIERSKLSGKKVLVVDDQEMITDLVSNILRSEGADVVTALEGETAVALFDDAPDSFDLAILDIVTPGMTGDHTASLIRNASPNLPILFMTGYAGNEGILRNLANELILPKPFTRSQLLNHVDSLLGQQQ